MKRILLSLCLLLSLALVGTVSAANTFVLSVGISDYPGDDHDLKISGTDALKFSELMKTQTKNVTTITSKNATRAQILESFGKICSTAKKGDRIVFYFSGHGSKKGYVLAADDQPLYYSDLSPLYLSSKASEVVFFIDACFAGTIVNDLKSTDKKIVFFLSSRPNEMSQEERFYVGRSYLTQALLKGMRGKADTDGNKKVTALELFKYVYSDVVARIDKMNTQINDPSRKLSQHPQLIAAPSSYDMVLTSW